MQCVGKTDRQQRFVCTVIHQTLSLLDAVFAIGIGIGQRLRLNETGLCQGDSIGLNG